MTPATSSARGRHHRGHQPITPSIAIFSRTCRPSRDSPPRHHQSPRRPLCPQGLEFGITGIRGHPAIAGGAVIKAIAERHLTAQIGKPGLGTGHGQRFCRGPRETVRPPRPYPPPAASGANASPAIGQRLGLGQIDIAFRLRPESRRRSVRLSSRVRSAIPSGSSTDELAIILGPVMRPGVITARRNGQRRAPKTCTSTASPSAKLPQTRWRSLRRAIRSADRYGSRPDWQARRSSPRYRHS